VLEARKRSAFADWARREDGFIVEDDYDGEFRYDQQPVGAMQARAPDRIVFAGSTSKTLAPGMRLGWLVVPPALRVPLLEVAAGLGAAVPAVQQLAMADLIARGGYDRHIRRMRLAYRRRRAELARVALEGVAAGLHALLPAESAERERVLIARGRRAGVALQGLHADGYWREPGGDRPAALIIGYATPRRTPGPGRWRRWPKWYRKPEAKWSTLLDRSVPRVVRMKMLLEQKPPFVPEGVEAMTVRLDLPPGDPGSPPHRHSGPVFGYMLEGEMIFELEGEPERVIRAGEAFWEPGGDVIHYQAANNLADQWSQFLVVMLCAPGQEMLVYVGDEELEQRRDRRAPRPADRS
jgi:quercetin dioxygenase-like cupin family protein